MSDWYKLETEDVISSFKSDAEIGLSSSEATSRLEKYGLNWDKRGLWVFRAAEPSETPTNPCLLFLIQNSRYDTKLECIPYD